MSTPFHGGALALLAPLLGAALTEAINAYLNAAMAATVLAAMVEGTAVWWLVMATRMRRSAHWFWRPFAWSAGLTISGMAALVANVALLIEVIEGSDESSLSSIVAIWIPALIALPFAAVVLVLALIASVRWALHAKGPVLAELRRARGASGSWLRSLPWGRWLVAVGLWAVARGVILFAQVLLGVGVVLMILPAMHLLAPGEPETRLGPSVVVFAEVLGLAIGACGVPLLRVARPGGPLQTPSSGSSDD